MVTGGRSGQRLNPIDFGQTPEQKALASEQIRAMAASREKAEIGSATSKYMDDYLGEKKAQRDETRLIARENVKSERENAEAYRNEGFVAARQIIGLSGMLETTEADVTKWLGSALGQQGTRQVSYGSPHASAAGKLLEQYGNRDDAETRARKIEAINKREDISARERTVLLREYKASQDGEVEVPDAVWEKVEALQKMRIVSTSTTGLTQEQKEFYIKTHGEIVVLMKEAQRKKRKAAMAYYEAIQRMAPRHTGQDRHLASLPPLEELLMAEEAIQRRSMKVEAPSPGDHNAPPPTPKPEPKPKEVQVPAPKSSALKWGSAGRSVKRLQRQLNRAGLLNSSSISGRYDDATVAAVKELQKRGNIKVDGIFGQGESAPALKRLIKNLPPKTDNTPGPPGDESPPSGGDGVPTGLLDARLRTGATINPNPDVRKSFTNGGVLQQRDAEAQIAAARKLITGGKAEKIKLRKSMGFTHESSLTLQASAAFDNLQTELETHDDTRAQGLEAEAKTAIEVHGALKDAEQQATTAQLLEQLAIGRSQPTGKRTSAEIAKFLDKNTTALSQEPLTSEEMQKLPLDVLREAVAFRITLVSETKVLQDHYRAKIAAAKGKGVGDVTQAEVNKHIDSFLGAIRKSSAEELIKLSVENKMAPTRAQVIGGDVLRVYGSAYKTLIKASEVRDTPQLSTVRGFLRPGEATENMRSALFDSVFDRLTVKQKQSVLHSPNAAAAFDNFVHQLQYDAKVAEIYYSSALSELKRLRKLGVVIDKAALEGFGQRVKSHIRAHLDGILREDKMWESFSKSLDRY